MASRTVRPQTDPGWHITPVFLRAATLGAVLLGAAVVFGRSDLLVLGTPLLIVTVWTLATRPRAIPSISGTVSATSPLEGSTEAWTLRIDCADAEQFAAYVGDRRMLTMTPESGAVAGMLDSGHVTSTLRWRPKRWGTREILGTRVAVFGSWGGFRYGTVRVPAVRVTTRPDTATFDSKRALPHPQGLIGVNRSNTKAEGTEFADIRQFQTGDRLRRIHWPVSARTGTLHVRTSFAEQDTEVLVVLDASADFTAADAETEHASSLDLGVRASAGVATHFLGRGDRVGLEVVGGMQPVRLPMGMGTLHSRRVVDCLAGIERGVGTGFRTASIRTRIRPGGVLLLVSPLLSPMPLALAAKLAQRGMTVLVIDCFPGEVPTDDAGMAIATRLRLLERDREIRAIQRLGVPVTAWRGPGSLDPALSRLSARPQPRVVRR
ncbi:hypothetical protein GCM10011492_03070 [Flexivirga endophytica]|uniref:DUF58 domain-containing protein n=1 Tax=Flexivirga endophytica TaxID=1849103 RepID=A0A916WMM1_9MICO|nr:DUF58 domain-containing protein [Flexivirga endophytica]GGB16682.1 hypothetical protein GCM10011492_03070 [Flexivirga endophytica]GHB38870.1 hypothetical protein GCM10008112_04540 [Flexivirga endophytica]